MKEMISIDMNEDWCDTIDEQYKMMGLDNAIDEGLLMIKI